MRLTSNISVLGLTTSLLILSAVPSFGQSDTQNANGENPTYVKGITPARARSLVGGVIGLASVVIGWCAKSKAVKNSKSSRSWGISALVLGLVAVILSIVHLAGNTGGFGTGGGKAGAIVALVLGIIGAALGGRAMRRR
jgi:hypothetical protein